MSKGSRQRPTDLKKFNENFDAIFRKDKRKEEDAKLEDEAFELINKQNSKVRETETHK